MEPVTRRIALHYTTERLDACLAFYRDLLAFNLPKDMVLANGQRWLVLTHPDNDGIQLHFHPPRDDESPHNPPSQIEFSHPDPHSLLPALRDTGHDVDEYEYPYTWGITVDDPPNELPRSCARPDARRDDWLEWVNKPLTRNEDEGFNESQQRGRPRKKTK